MTKLLIFVFKLLFFMIVFMFVYGQSFALTPYSTRELEELEKEFVQQINQSSSVLRNPLAIQYINQLGAKLGQAGHIHSPWFFIVYSMEINAFAGPGGYIGINTALIEATSRESELAAVMAHELAHVRLHHLYSMIEHQKQMRIPMLASILASAALGVINPTLGSGALMASMNGFAQNNINYTRSKEKEADRIGIGMLIKAGFNPMAMAGFFKKMQEHSRYYYTGNIPAILRTHPLDDDRIAEAENRSLHLKNQPFYENFDYFLFKEIVRTESTADPQKLLTHYRGHCPQEAQKQACLYGMALTEIRLNHYAEAEKILQNILIENSSSLFYQTAMARAEIGLKKYDQALERLEQLQKNSPDNYAALMAHADGLMAAGKGLKAVDVLLKGSRKFNKDLLLCEKLARAHSSVNQKAYAYLTEARCQLLQGRSREAVRQLKIVKSMSKNNEYLSARAEAMIQEIKFVYSN